MNCVLGGASSSGLAPFARERVSVPARPISGWLVFISVEDFHEPQGGGPGADARAFPGLSVPVGPDATGSASPGQARSFRPGPADAPPGASGAGPVRAPQRRRVGGLAEANPGPQL